MVGMGFAKVTEARGVLNGSNFTISNHGQLFMSYGHHAFTRSALMFFDAPIGEACGLYVDEVTGNSGVWTVDCNGIPINPLNITEEVHEYQQGPCAE